jgi:hypothetical protein
VVLAGIAGLSLTYFRVAPFLPEYEPGLLSCGALVVGGATLFLAASSTDVWARFARPASALMVVAALGASVYTGVAARLWFQVVIQFS